MLFEVGDLNEGYVNIDRVGADADFDLYQFSRPVEGLSNISVQPLQAPVSVEILDNFGNVLSAVNASESYGGSLFFEHSNPSDYLLKISSTDGETPYQVSISPDSEIDPITNWGIAEGFFVVDSPGEVSVDYLFDGGSYQGELAIFSLKGMENLSLGSTEFITEAARRALSNSRDGHVVISDSLEGAKSPSGNNSGEYLGLKTVAMEPGDVFAVMLVPNGTVQEVYENPGIGENKRPLFSLATANPEDAFLMGQIGDLTGSGSAFVMEDLRVDTGSDRDYNDIIWQFSGAVGLATPVAELIAPEKDWRNSEVGLELLNAIASTSPLEPETVVEPSASTSPLEPETVVEPSASTSPLEPETVVEPSASAENQKPVETSLPVPASDSAPSEVAPPVENEPTVAGASETSESNESQDDGQTSSNQENLAVAEEAVTEEDSSPDFTDTEIDPSLVPEVTEDMISGASAPTTLHPAAVDDTSILPTSPLLGISEQFEAGIGEEIIWASSENPEATARIQTSKEFTSSVLAVGETELVDIDFLFDGGKYFGEVAIFSLSGLDGWELGSPEFIQEVVSRALSNSVLEYVTISDRFSWASFSGLLGESSSCIEGLDSFKAHEPVGSIRHHVGSQWHGGGSCRKSDPCGSQSTSAFDRH